MAAYNLEDYTHLIEAFTTGKMPVADFEREYLRRFKEDESRHPEAQFQILDALFADVDAYCADPELRDEDDLDEETLRSRATKALAQLRLISHATPLRKWRVIENLSLPELRQAAAGHSEPSEPIKGPDYEVYTHDGRRMLWIQIKSGQPVPEGVWLHLKSGERGGRWRYPIEEVDHSGQATVLYVVLGTPEELRHAAAQAMGRLPAANEPFHLEVELELPDGTDAASSG
ncbi:colicin immunity domain-containing protein [Archangium sp.]|uniref:colicin immunity domain-containing protein n=1 Tax=Archangium sp. TaxID=1872627 RepID=UPI002D6603C8|nr:colicin immunity domain-containing protein [Archangium sp.]HYO57003.1 colicin immunity domain-containing protein [Archangium sp.]